MCLDFCRPPYSPEYRELQRITTPLQIAAWEAVLRTHPDRAFARFLLRESFRIGFDRCTRLRPATHNMHSAAEHPEVVQAYLNKECALGRMLGPLQKTNPQPYHTNWCGVIPKGHNTEKWRLITDLSYPPGESVNDGISPDLCSLSYSSVEEVAKVMAHYDRGGLMAKIDIESAYRLIPVHPDDCPLQAVEWKGYLYMDLMLPFGLRSAPKLFNAVADAMEWHLPQRGVEQVFHYLDDFIVLGHPNSTECARMR